MLTQDAKNEISRCMTAIAAAMPGFRRRQSQRVMINAVAKTLARCPDPSDASPADARDHGTTIVCVNAGTGCGKSLGYGTVGAVMARLKRKKLVISTATVALQEQLLLKDLPFFYKSAGLALTIALAKGRTRYLCQYLLDKALASSVPSVVPTDGVIAASPADHDPAAATILLDMRTSFESGAWDGDRDMWPQVEDRLWNTITTDRNGCIGPLCPRSKTCAQAAARQRLKNADVIVANHDLVLADIAMGGGKILPAPAETFYVFDEAHHLPEKAVAMAATHHVLGADRVLVERTLTLIEQLATALGLPFHAQSRSMTLAGHALISVLSEAYDFFDSLAMLRPSDQCPNPVLDFEQSFVPEEFEPIGATIVREATHLMDGLRSAANDLLVIEAPTTQAKHNQEELMSSLGKTIGRLEKLLAAWSLFVEVPSLDQPPIAKWVSTVQRAGRLDFQISASPVLAGRYLADNLWRRAAGVVLTSANLATFGHFDHFRRRAGLASLESITCVDLPSPFDYHTQGVIEIPAMRSAPQSFEDHTAEVVEHVSTYLPGGDGDGTLVLFTSTRQMLEVARRLPEPIRRLVLVQGTDTKTALIATHKAAVDRGESSAIFGLESFSEGVDLAGRYCTHVVITKLPFDVPNTPVLKALCQWIDQCGGRSFLEVLVPVAARKLEQRVGRLIRTETDSGRITVLDTRLWDKAYGRMMLRGLPPFRLMVRGQEMAA